MRMRIGWIAGLAGVAVLLAGAALAGASPADPACSTGRLFGVRAPLFVLATAGTDTVRAGPGPIEYNARRNPPDSLARIHGQRFRLDRVGGDVPAELAGAEGGEAVLVPYGWECRDTWRWHQARWAEPGVQLVADATLRPRVQWVDGRPTFDVEVVHDVYPNAFTPDADSAAEFLRAAEVFGLYQALPTWNEVEADPAAAYRRFLGWARAHPAQAGRFPASYAMREAQEWLQPCKPAYDPHPVAGTYRADFVLHGRDTLTAFLRTDSRGYPMCGDAETRLDLAAVQPRMADTARLYVFGSAAGEASIPATNAEAWQAENCSVVKLDVFNQPRTDEAGRRAGPRTTTRAG